jgi:Proteasome subunit
MLLCTDTSEEGSSTKPVSLACLADRRYNLHKKLCQVDDSVYLAFAGLAADGRVLLDYIRVCKRTYTNLNPLQYSVMLVLVLQITCFFLKCVWMHFSARLLVWFACSPQQHSSKYN